MHDSCCEDKKGCTCCGGTLSCVARCTYAVPMLIFGLFHFLSGQAMVGALTGWPFALFFVYLSGAGLVLGALAIMLNRYARTASFLLALEIALFVLIIHLPVVLAGGEGMQMAVASMLKDVALIGGALVIGTHSMDRGFSKK